VTQRWLRRVGAGAALSLAALGIWAFWFEPSQLVVHEETLELPRWPDGEPLRLALLSDLHVGSPHWGLTQLAQLVEETNASKPELVLLAGDYLINGVWLGTWVDPESIAMVLARLRAPLGVIAVLGNHDWWNDGERVRRAFTAQGIVVLENRALSVRRGAFEFFVVGLADVMTRNVDIQGSLAQVPAGAAQLVLSHEPDVFASMDERVALTLAGHTHGGQVRLPLLGRPVVPSSYGQRYAAGHVVEQGRHLFVTTGVGTSIIPVRFGVPPELVLLELR
jgi:predicted MPP superfamily phosphohydrolase